MPVSGVSRFLSRSRAYIALVIDLSSARWTDDQWSVHITDFTSPDLTQPHLS